MARFKINLKDTLILKDRIRRLRKPINRKDGNRLGRGVVEEIKNTTLKGGSSVRGGEFGGRMPKYKPSYLDSIKRGRFPGKKIRPVNLRLTGDFMKSLKFKLAKTPQGFAPDVGYFNRKSKQKEEGHREGANNQEKRPTIPEPKKGEKFGAKIDVFIRRFYRDTLRKLIKQSRVKRN